jgi:hypothetical protein
MWWFWTGQQKGGSDKGILFLFSHSSLPAKIPYTGPNLSSTTAVKAFKDEEDQNSTEASVTKNVEKFEPKTKANP